MGVLDFLLGGTDGAIEDARRDNDLALQRGRELVGDTVAQGRADRAAVTSLVQREIENARAIGNLRDPLEVRAATAGIRARVSGERRAALAAAGATGASASVDVATARGIGEALDAEKSVRIRRTAQSTQQIAALTGQLGQITQAGFAAELGAANAEASRGVESTLQISQAAIEAASQKNKALIGAIGGFAASGGIGALGGKLSGGFDFLSGASEDLIPDVVGDFFSDFALNSFGGSNLFG